DLRSAKAGPAEIFVDEAAAVGLGFRHVNGQTGEFHFPEVVGSGAALFDYDNDGDPDVLFVQSGKLVAAPGETESFSARLFRNDLSARPDGSRSLRFTDVTAQSRIATSGYGMGVATGDYDGDGWVDFYVTSFGSAEMWRNNGDGTFANTTARTGTNVPLWNSGASFVDFDRDGDLDLYVATYVNWRLANHKPCKSKAGNREYCGPQTYEGEPDRLFRNRGDGTFEDVTGAAGIFGEKGNGLGVIATDFNRDGWTDIYVANDLQPNNLWLNQGDGTFRDEAILAGCAVDRNGAAQASMGLEAADFDNDGDDDLFMTHLNTENSMLYRNDGTGFFDDRAVESQLGRLNFGLTGFGTAFFDFDNDSWLDLFVANGAVHEIEPLVRAGDPVPYHELNKLFRNKGDGTFEDVSAGAGKVLELSEVSRGVAVGDVDNDGDPDIVLTNNNGPARLLMNQVGGASHWLGLRLLLPGGKRDALGAQVEIRRTPGPSLRRRVHTDGSYFSARDPRVLFGLGDRAEPVTLRVTWPDGKGEEWQGIPVDRYSGLVQGTGTEVAS
ncbi:MAG: CRTAC1 family protein, partial [Candidatus Binatia bacterium]